MAELQTTKEKTDNSKVRASINVDIGGTFTDCLITYGDEMVFGKAPTTTYDLSRGFMQALRETVDSLGMSLEDLLEIQKALKTIIQKATHEKMEVLPYRERYFLTNDGFKIGYFQKSTEQTVFVDLDDYQSEDTYFFDGFSGLSKTINQGIEKINSLKGNL